MAGTERELSREPFKNLINAGVIAGMAGELQEVWPEFPARRFKQLAGKELDSLELKQRVMQVRDALAATLPEDFAKACDIIEASLAPVTHSSRIEDIITTGKGISGWPVWPLTEFIALAGINAPERALCALHALTQRLTAEFAIRPFMLQHTQLTLETLQHWTCDPSPHVRRLASEGSRPRLPWGLRLGNVIENPQLTRSILNALCTDESDYVRKSVANHLNDISKDHPDLAVAMATSWLKKRVNAEKKKQLERLIRHALRTLIKQGHPGALKLAGFDHEASIDIQVAPLKRKTWHEGESLPIEATLHNPGDSNIRVSLDYAVHFLRANGTHSAKIFKWSKLELAPGESLTLQKAHPLAAVTTRRHYPGEHWLDVRINGIAHGRQRFVLKTG